MTNIYGECYSGSAHAPVTIFRLGADDCDLRFDDPKARLRGDLALWIGAIGPLEITADDGGRRRMTARFKHPLEPAIVAHFSAQGR